MKYFFPCSSVIHLYLPSLNEPILNLPETGNRDVGAHIIMDEEKHESPLKQLDRVCLFMTMFPLIFTIYSTNARSFPLHLVSSWFPPGG